MNTAHVLPIETTEIKYNEWHIIPDHYTLQTVTGHIICSLIFPGNDTESDTTFLRLIASVPELRDIAEMYRDSMTGNRAEKSMIFDIVCEILGRLQ